MMLLIMHSLLQTINQVMKPGAAKAVHSWLQDADDKGKQLNSPK